YPYFTSAPHRPQKACSGSASPLMGIDLMSLPGCQMSKHFSAALAQHVTRFSCQASAHIVGLTIDHEIPSGPDRASKGLLLDLHEPAIRIDRLGNRRQRRKRWTGHPRRLVTTGARLLGPLVIGVGQKREGSLR